MSLAELIAQRNRVLADIDRAEREAPAVPPAKWWRAGAAQEFQAVCDAHLAEYGRRAARVDSYADIFLNNVYADEVSGLRRQVDDANHYESRVYTMGIPPFFWPGYVFPQTVVFDDVPPSDVPTLRPPAPAPPPPSPECPCGITRADCEYHRP